MTEDSPQLVRMKLSQVNAATVVAREPLLERASLMQVLGRDAQGLLALSGVRRYPQGATLYSPGDAPALVYLVARGEVTLLTGAGADATPVHSLGTGDCFGAGAALEIPQRTVTARASQECDLIELPAMQLRLLASQSPGLNALLEALHKKLAGAASELNDFLDRW